MPLLAQEIHAHLAAQCPWVDWAATCDGFEHGHPQAPVMGIAVGWQATNAALEEARALDCNLFIAHEQTFYPSGPDGMDAPTATLAERKRAWLDAAGMVVYRCHDGWDLFPGQGVLDAWGDFLALGEPCARDRFHRVYALPPISTWELTCRVGVRVAQLGEQAVQLVGPRTRPVRRVGIGTGAICHVRAMAALGAEVAIVSDDGIFHWRDSAWAQDAGISLIIVNHQTAEMPGMRGLVAHLGEHFPQTHVHLVGGACSYEIMATQRSREITLRMRRDTLDGLPPVALPPGYTLRDMRADQVWAYIQVMNGSIYAGDADAAWFERTFTKDPAYDPSFLQIIWRGGQPVAASGAWHSEIEGERWGMVHFVGVLASERGAGLGKAIALAALHRLRARGMARAMLDTHIWRLPAVAAYLSLGFAPWPNAVGTEAVWADVQAELARWRQEMAQRPNAG